MVDRAPSCAGGQPARATLLFKLEDKRIQQFFLGGKYPTREHSARIYALVHDSDVAAGPARTGTERSNGLTVDQLVLASEFPAKRVKTVVAQLCGVGLAQRVRGRIVPGRRAENGDELENILRGYEQRHHDDGKRLELMMRYAQSTNCRVQLLREYFSEPRGEPCRHCDNCRDDPAHALARTGRQHGPRPAPSVPLRSMARPQRWRAYTLHAPPGKRPEAHRLSCAAGARGGAS